MPTKTELVSRPSDLGPISPAKMISLSMERFAEYLSGDPLTSYMSRLRKNDQEDNHEFFLKGVNARHYSVIERRFQGEFYMDTYHAFALGIKDSTRDRPLWIGVVSFLLGKDLDFYSSYLEDVMNEFENPCPIIVQLQGANDETYCTTSDYEEAKQVLNKYKWERALIGIVSKWAQATNAAGVFLLPGYENRWSYKFDDEGQKLHLRYDVSARRMGFRMQPNGLYGELF